MTYLQQLNSGYMHSVETHPVARERSRRHLMKSARKNMELGMERQKVCRQAQFLNTDFIPSCFFSWLRTLLRSSSITRHSCSPRPARRLYSTAHTCSLNLRLCYVCCLPPNICSMLWTQLRSQTVKPKDTSQVKHLYRYCLRFTIPTKT